MRQRLKPGTVVSAITQNLFASAVSSTLTIAFCLSYAALIFSGPLTPWLGYGIAVSFLSAAIGGFVVALRSSVPFAVAGPDSATSAVTATLAAVAAERLQAYDSTGQLLGPVVIVLAISAALSGIVLCCLGLTRGGRAIRFVPYSVIAGFLGASGWLIVSGAVRVIAGQPITNLDTMANASSLGKLAAGLAIALVLFISRYRLRNLFALPAMLLLSMVAIHIVFLLGGISLDEAEASGWTFAPQSASALTLRWHTDELRLFPWKLLPSLSGEFFAVVFVTTISMLLNLTGIELATQREADLDRELNALGLANAASAAFGGYVNCVSLSRSILNYAAGASGRLSGIIVAAISASMLVINPSFLAYVPKCALGGLLFYIGFDLIYRWLIASWRQVLFVEYIALAAIALIIISWGFIAGVLIGLVIGCAIFALNASRVNAIKFSFDGTNYRSSLDRDAADLALLNKAGQQIQGMCLQSYLFFGSSPMSRCRPPAESQK
jgi:SulP family sulfate permease